MVEMISVIQDFFGNSALQTVVVAVVLAFVILSAFFSLFRRAWKSGLRLITVIISAVGAFAMSFALKDSFREMIEESIIPSLSATYPEVEEGYAYLLAAFPQNTAVIEDLVCSLFLPIFFLLIFIGFLIVTWVAYLILSLILRIGAGKGKRRPIFSALIGALQACIVVAVFIMPLSCYLELSDIMVDNMEKNGMLDADNEFYIGVEADDETLVKLRDFNDSALLKVYRACGGNALCTALTSVSNESGRMSSLKTEIDCISDVACGFTKLAMSDVYNEYTAQDAQLVVDLVEKLTDSERSLVLPSLSREIVYNLTDAWMYDESFLGLPSPEIGEPLSSLFDSAIELLNEDSKNAAYFSDDFKTIANLFLVLAEGEVFKMYSEGRLSLVNVLGNSDVINRSVEVLESNLRTRPLVAELKTMAMSAISNYVVADLDDLDPKYTGLITDIADVLDNNTPDNVSELTEEQRAARTEAVKNGVVDAFEAADIPISDAIVDMYADEAIEYYDQHTDDFSDPESIIKSFIESYVSGDIKIPDEVIDDITEGLLG